MPTLHHVLIKSLGSTTMPKLWTCGILSWILARPSMLKTLELVLLLEEFQWILDGRLSLATETCVKGVVIGGGRVDDGVNARGRHGQYLL
jgi:hypothetical protein